MKPKILIVDDSQFTRLLIRKCIEKNMNAEIKEANDGHEALKVFKDFEPHIVFMDINMPKMDGITALKKIRSFNKDAIIVMVTALEQQSITRDLKSLPNVAFIAKPFDCNALLNMLTSYIKRLV
ncbi:MAG: two-component system response regulator [Thermoprotei archaeon]|nr:MAG: two-component system response regulator [Thermoprotei archaeon]